MSKTISITIQTDYETEGALWASYVGKLLDQVILNQKCLSFYVEEKEV